MKKKLVILVSIISIIALTGCATIMEPKNKMVTLQSNHKMKVRYDDELVGSGKFVSFDALNRSKGQNKLILAESLETGETRPIKPSYSMNNWLFADFLIDWGIISIPTDLLSGGYKKLDKTTYYIEFEETESNSDKLSALKK